MVELCWLIDFFQRTKLKTREGLETEGHTCQSLAYVQLTGRFKLDKETFDFTNGKTDFELDLCTNDEHVVARMIRFTENEHGRLICQRLYY